MTCNDPRKLYTCTMDFSWALDLPCTGLQSTSLNKQSTDKAFCHFCTNAIRLLITCFSPSTIRDNAEINHNAKKAILHVHFIPLTDVLQNGGYNYIMYILVASCENPL